VCVCVCACLCICGCGKAFQAYVGAFRGVFMCVRVCARTDIAAKRASPALRGPVHMCVCVGVYVCMCVCVYVRT